MRLSGWGHGCLPKRRWLNQSRPRRPQTHQCAASSCDTDLKLHTHSFEDTFETSSAIDCMSQCYTVRHMAPEWNPSCELARERLSGCEELPRSRNLPRGSTSYFPRSAIVKVLEGFPVEEIFTCSCERCRHYAGVKGGVDERSKAVDTNELLGRYATIYGLLIYLRYPGLISLFLRHRIYLETSYLSDGNLFFISKSKSLSPTQAEIVKKEIIESQYRLLVKTVLKRKTISTIEEQEILPIQEDDTPVGTGDFGEVYAFHFPLEYTDQSLGPQLVSYESRKYFRLTV
jgi:hypothetical protein